MKHTDFTQLRQHMKLTLRDELIAAINAHGGEYVFSHLDEDGEYDYESLEEGPMVFASSEWTEHYRTYYVVRVNVDDNRGIHIFGVPRDDWSQDEREVELFSADHLEYILDEIPETEEVKSVFTPKLGPTRILTLSSEDVENVGYDSNMTVAVFKELRRLMEKSFEWNMDIYWDALRQACENLGLPTLKTDESSTK